MNRSYRSIWNESLGAWVATSEVTKAKGKRSRQGRAAVTAVDAPSGVAQTTMLPITPRVVARAAAMIALGSMGMADMAMAQTVGKMYLGTGSYSNSQGTVCIPATGVSTTTSATSYTCTVALPNGAVSTVTGISALPDGSPNFAEIPSNQGKGGRIQTRSATPVDSVNEGGVLRAVDQQFSVHSQR
jgi:hypothetical protein